MIGDSLKWVNIELDLRLAFLSCFKRSSDGGRWTVQEDIFHTYLLKSSVVRFHSKSGVSFPVQLISSTILTASIEKQILQETLDVAKTETTL